MGDGRPENSNNEVQLTTSQNPGEINFIDLMRDWMENQGKDQRRHNQHDSNDERQQNPDTQTEQSPQNDGGNNIKDRPAARNTDGNNEYRTDRPAARNSNSDNENRPAAQNTDRTNEVRTDRPAARNAESNNGSTDHPGHPNALDRIQPRKESNDAARSAKVSTADLWKSFNDQTKTRLHDYAKKAFDSVYNYWTACS